MSVAARSSVDAVAQSGGRIAEPEPPRVQPDALLGLGQRVVDPLDLAAQRPGPVQPLGRAPRVGHLGQPVRHLAEQVGHLAAQLAEGVLGGLHPQRSEHQAGGQSAAAPISVSVIRLVAAACESTEKISMALIGTSRISSRSRSTMRSTRVRR